jgi:hypothetical protein
MMRDLAPTSHEHERYAQALRIRMQRVEAVPAFERRAQQSGKPLIAHYHLLLAAYLMHLSGEPSRFEERILKGAERALVDGPPAPPTVRLTVAVLIERLEGASPVPPEQLREQGLIGHIGRGYRIALPARMTEPDRRRIGLQLYALVHEVLALTDFGRQRPLGWLAARTDALVSQIRRGIRWAQSTGNVDLAAELLVSADLLGARLDDAFGETAIWLARTQSADGSWGEQTTVRENRTRHATMTAAFALVVYRGTVASRSECCSWFSEDRRAVLSAGHRGEGVATAARPLAGRYSRWARMNMAARTMASLDARSSANVRTFSPRKSKPRPTPG